VKTTIKHRRAAAWGLAVCLSLLLAGCGASDNNTAPDVSGPASTAAASGPASSQNSSQGNPLEVAGVTDYAAFKKQFLTFQDAVARNDREQAATFALYPIRVNVGKVAVNVADKEAFVKQYDRILTEDVRKALAAQDVNTLFANDKGIMVGNGEIWFGVAPGTPERYGIISVNIGEDKK